MFRFGFLQSWKESCLSRLSAGIGGLSFLEIVPMRRRVNPEPEGMDKMENTLSLRRTPHPVIVV